MFEPSAGITFKVMQEMMPENNIPPDSIEDVVAAMLPPPDGVSAAPVTADDGAGGEPAGKPAGEIP
jgi:hypothetical protein